MRIALARALFVDPTFLYAGLARSHPLMHSLLGFDLSFCFEAAFSKGFPAAGSWTSRQTTSTWRLASGWKRR